MVCNYSFTFLCQNGNLVSNSESNAGFYKTKKGQQTGCPFK